MKPMLLVTALAAILAPQAAQAQSEKHQQQQNPGHADRAAPQSRGARSAPAPRVQQMRPQSARPAHAQVQDRAPSAALSQPARRPSVINVQRQRNSVANTRIVQPSRNPSYTMAPPSNFRPQRATTFRYPRGYRYRRWSVGRLLPSIFISSSYYYDGYASFGISAPPRGYRWVRYGSDLLLVNKRTGRIARVIYGAFY